MYISSKRIAKAIKTYVYYMRTLILYLLLLRGTAERRDIEAFHVRLIETVVITCATRVAGVVVKQT